MWNLLLILVTSAEEAAAARAAEALADKIKSGGNLLPIGPADAPVAKISDIYRKVIYIKTEDYRTLVEVKDVLEDDIRENGLFKEVSVQFDFNPL